MRATGLRIGNLVSMPDKSVKEISALDLFQFSEHFSPIPLTEEWLDRFDISIFEFYKCAGGFKFFIRVGDMEVETFIAYKIEFVHRLQNWHFEIFNSELQIKQTV